MPLLFKVLFPLLLSFGSCSGLQQVRKNTSLAPKSTSLKSRNTGALQLIWAKDLNPSYESGNLPISQVSPLIHEGILFTGSADGKFLAYNLENGRLLWQKIDLGAYSGGATMYGDHLIYGTSEGRLYSRHYITGKEIYEVDVGEAPEVAPLVFGDRVVFHLRNHVIICLDASTGKILWNYKRSVSQSTTLQGVSRPVVWENKLYVGFADGFLAAFSLEEGELLWDKKLVDGNRFIDLDASAAISNGRYLVGPNSSAFVVGQAESGEILRQLNFTSGIDLVAFENFFVVGTNDGKIIKLGPSGETLLSQNLEGGMVTSLNRWYQHLVVASSKGKIFLVNAETFQVEDTFHLGHKFSTVYGKMAISDEFMALFSSRHHLYVFKKRAPLSDFPL